LIKKRTEEGNDLRVFRKDYTILNSIYDINTARESVKQSTLVKSWRKILPSVENTLIEYAEEEQEEVSAFMIWLISPNILLEERMSMKITSISG